MKIKQGLAIVLSGMIWMGVGVMLLIKGFSLLLHPVIGASSLLLPYFDAFSVSREQASLVLVASGLVLGFLKGRFVLAKSASRVIARIVSLPNPLPITKMYGRSYVILLASMILLGMSLRFLPVPYDLKGIVDVAIGSALTNGSAYYFRHFAEKRAKT